MTPTTTATKTAPAARTTEAERLLRDAAFVLKLTRQIKADILCETAGPRSVIRAAERIESPLGV